MRDPWAFSRFWLLQIKSIFFFFFKLTLAVEWRTNYSEQEECHSSEFYDNSKPPHLGRFFSLDLDFPCGSAGKESACNAGDLGLIPELGRSPGEGKGYPPQYSGLENSMGYIVHRVTESWTRLSGFHFSLDLEDTSDQPAFVECLVCTVINHSFPYFSLCNYFSWGKKHGQNSL